MAAVVKELPVSPATSLPLMRHCRPGAFPPFDTVALNESEVPVQAGLDKSLELIAIEGVTDSVIATGMFAEVPVALVAFKQ
jgi:hypothetical protein